jgi:thiosulfate/3-mercaptopyruvate sulfurtransferase
MSIPNTAGRTITLLALLALAVPCAAVQTSPEPAVEREVEAPASAIESLVTTRWLSEHLDDPDLVVLDCTVTYEATEDGGFRTFSGRAAYETGHIPGAGFADLLGDLSDTEAEHQYAVPTPKAFAAAMAALGVGDDSRVVLYDAGGSMWASRVWWMLRWIGFDRAALLDGGLGAWTAEGRPLSTEAVERPAATLTPAPRPELIADKDEVLAAIEDASVHIVDVLPVAHFRGDMAMYGRPGHIPSAVNISVMELTDETGHFRPLDELAALYSSDNDARYITYCGGGIAASASAFVMTRLGFTDVAVYTASLQEWAADPDLPMETVTVE